MKKFKSLVVAAAFAVASSVSVADDAYNYLYDEQQAGVQFEYFEPKFHPVWWLVGAGGSWAVGKILDELWDMYMNGQDEPLREICYLYDKHRYDYDLSDMGNICSKVAR